MMLTLMYITFIFVLYCIAVIRETYLYRIDWDKYKNAMIILDLKPMFY